jgi:hypothetical protein
LLDLSSLDFSQGQGGQGIARRPLLSDANFRSAKVDSFRLPEGRGRRPSHKTIPQANTEIAEKPGSLFANEVRPGKGILKLHMVGVGAGQNGRHILSEDQFLVGGNYVDLDR